MDVVVQRDSVRIDIGADVNGTGPWPVVRAVLPGSPTDAAGLLVGDVVLFANGRSTRGAAGVVDAAAERDASVRLRVKQLSKSEIELVSTMPRMPRGNAQYPTDTPTNLPHIGAAVN